MLGFLVRSLRFESPHHISLIVYKMLKGHVKWPSLYEDCNLSPLNLLIFITEIESASLQQGTKPCIWFFSKYHKNREKKTTLLFPFNCLLKNHTQIESEVPYAMPQMKA